MEAEECTTRWKSLRDKFVREVKKLKEAKVVMQDLSTHLLGHSIAYWNSF